MSGFRRNSSVPHVVHAIQLPELVRRRRVVLARQGTRGTATQSPATATKDPRLATSAADRRALPVPQLDPTPRVDAKNGSGGDDRRIELLERRLEKLSRLLGERDDQLRSRIAQADEDVGVASRFAEVQGLNGHSEEVQLKRDLMSSIFDANRKLRERIGSQNQVAE